MDNIIFNADAVVGVIFLGRKRPGFDMEWGFDMEKRVREFFREHGVNTVEAPEKIVDEQSLRAGMKAFAANGANVLLVMQGTMGDARLSQSVAQMWCDPVVIWATPENSEGEMISSCSLVGTHNWGSVFRQLGHPFEFVYGAPEKDDTVRQFSRAVNIALTARRLRHARLGIVGGQAPGYFAMAADTFVTFRQTGAQTQTYSLIEFDAIVNGFTEEQVRADIAEFRKLGIPHKDTSDEDLPMASRLYLAMKHLLDSESLDALTVRCWPEMASHFGQWPYAGMARLIDEGQIVACEGDADGALGMLMGKELGLGPCFLTDWLEHDRRTVTAWHIGATPTSFCPPPGEPGGPCLARHFNIRKPAIFESSLLEDMPVTIVRFWRCDGRYLVTAREGRTVKPLRRLLATNSLIEMTNENPVVWFDDLIHEGMPHHVNVFRGHHQDFIRRFARTIEMKFI